MIDAISSLAITEPLKLLRDTKVDGMQISFSHKIRGQSFVTNS